MPMLLTKLMASGLGAGLANAFAADTADSQTATGTNQATAFETSTAFVRFTTVASGTGCLLDNGARGDSQVIINAGANTLSVYPHVGGTINQLAANAAFSIPAGSWAAFDRYTDARWTGSNDASLASFIQSGTGAITTETVQAALRRTVFLGQYDTLANYRTARDALSQTMGTNILQVTGTLAVGAASSTEAVAGYTASLLGTEPRLVVKSAASSGSAGVSLFHTGSREYLLKTTTNNGGNFSIGHGTGDGTISTNWLRLIGTSTAIDFGTTATAHFITGTPGTEIVHRIQGDPTNKVVSWEAFRSVDDILNPTNYERVQIVSDQVTANTFTLRTDAGGTGTVRNLEICRGTSQMALFASTGLTFDSGGTGSISFRTNLGTEQFKVTHTATAVNIVQAAGGAAGGPPTLWANGSDTDVDFVLSPKGAGAFKFQTSSFGVNQVWIAHTASALNYLILTGGVSGANASIKTSAENLLFGSGSAIATTATAGYVMFPSCAGTPTGVPTGQAAGKIPMIFDTTGVKLWFYTGGAWKGVVVA